MSRSFDVSAEPRIERIVVGLEDALELLSTLSEDRDSVGDPVSLSCSHTHYQFRDTLKEMKTDLFGRMWEFVKQEEGLSNIPDDETVLDSLRKQFIRERGMNWIPLRGYMAGLQGDAPLRAYESIITDARKAFPVFWEDHDRRDPMMDELCSGKKTIRLRAYRDGWDNERISYKERGTLAALDKLGQMIVWKVSALEARVGVLYGEYNGSYQDSANGKRQFAGGPFAAAQSFKNGRFDLEFRTEADAKAFARALLRIEEV